MSLYGIQHSSYAMLKYVRMNANTNKQTNNFARFTQSDLIVKMLLWYEE